MYKVSHMILCYNVLDCAIQSLTCITMQVTSEALNVLAQNEYSVSLVGRLAGAEVHWHFFNQLTQLLQVCYISIYTRVCVCVWKFGCKCVHLLNRSSVYK
jgi:hypothetical protein